MSGILSFLLTAAGMASMFYLGAQWRLRQLQKAIAAVEAPALDLGVFTFRQLRSGAKSITFRMSDDGTHWDSEVVRVMDAEEER
ncbi:hypothetical protein B3_51 [Propionibacterium phage B3]|uniref:Uncharacterized protein n=1 Tax=Propionibacterium phage B3 TaxID=1897533 RepID=A0A1D8ETF9_9CAUD|nr:hypothetical protein FDH09_gp51 [Propionibacterium phage B3]AOT24344.1 hypothetical protein B3_51 [Propionibacterium phage B3]